MSLRLARPALDMEAAYLDFAAEWADEGREIVPYSARLLGRTYREWLERLPLLESAGTCPEGLVPAHTFFLLEDDGRILGAINIRHRLNDYLFQYGGHIGYGVRRSERGKGYASAMLGLALPIAARLGLRKVLITCNKSNIASAGTILRCGGVLENEVPEDGGITQRYWIAL